MSVAGSSGSEAIVVSAYDYVLQQRLDYNSSNGADGAFVVAVNSSFGVDYGNPVNYPIWCGFYNTMGAAGILNVAATANQNINVDVSGDIPTTCTSNYLISVGNSTRTDTRNTGSAYGTTHIDLAAPGTTIYSTITASGYGNLTGTSMATPVVTGMIGLMYSYPCASLGTSMHAAPAAFALLVKSAILNGVDSIPVFGSLYLSAGRANAFKALTVLGANCAGTPLSANAVSFTAQKSVQNTAAALRWTVGVEKSIETYEVQRSADGDRFEAVGRLAADGRSAYFITDNTPVSGTNHYRLSMLENGGARQYTAVQTLTFGHEGSVEVTPTPARESVLITSADESLAGTEGLILDASGRLMRRFSMAGSQRIWMGNWASGLYLLKLTNGQVIKLVKE